MQNTNGLHTYTYIYGSISAKTVINKFHTLQVKLNSTTTLYICPLLYRFPFSFAPERKCSLNTKGVNFNLSFLMENDQIEVAVPQGYLSNHYFLYTTASETM